DHRRGHAGRSRGGGQSVLRPGRSARAVHPLGDRVDRGRSRARGLELSRAGDLSSHSMPPVQVDRAFSRRAGFQAYLIAGLSLAYALVFLGFVRGHPADHSSAALAWALLAAGGLATTIAVVAASGR